MEGGFSGRGVGLLFRKLKTLTRQKESELVGAGLSGVLCPAKEMVPSSPWKRGSHRKT